MAIINVSSTNIFSHQNPLQAKKKLTKQYSCILILKGQYLLQVSKYLPTLAQDKTARCMLGNIAT